MTTDLDHLPNVWTDGLNTDVLDVRVIRAQEIQDAARRLHLSGATVIPVRPNDAKKPGVPQHRLKWRQYQSVRPTGREMRYWFPGGQQEADRGLAVIYGAASGGLMMLEFEGRAIEGGWLERAQSAAADAGLADLWDAVMGGWVESSPSGGIHFHIRVTGGPVPPNTKLAFVADGECAIETRGEGGYAVRAPSGGPVHASGRAWETLTGSGPQDAPAVPLTAVCALFDVMRSLCQAPKLSPEELAAKARRAERARTVDRSGDSDVWRDFNERADWTEVVAGYFHTPEVQHDGCIFMTREGKDAADGHSASIGYGGNFELMHVWSAPVTAPHLPVGVSYDKPKMYGYLRYGAWNDAVRKRVWRELREAGYGSEPDEFMHGSEPGQAVTTWMDEGVARIREATSFHVEDELETQVYRAMRAEPAEQRAALRRFAEAAVQRGMTPDDVAEIIRYVREDA